MLVSIPGTPIDAGVYHCVRNVEMKPTVVSKVVGMAGNGRATVAPMDQPIMARPFLPVNGQQQRHWAAGKQAAGEQGVSSE